MEPEPTGERDRFLVLSSAGVWLHALCFLGFARVQGFHAALFAALLTLTQPLVFALPPVLLLLPFRRLARRSAAFYIPAVMLFSAVHLLIAGDRFLYSLYSFHANGFVWNLVTTPGGIASLATTTSAQGVIALSAGVLIALEAALVLPARRLRFVVSRRVVLRTAAMLALLLLVEKLDYGWSRFRQRAPVLAVAEAFPFYLHLDLSRPAQALGFRRGRHDPGLPAPVEGLRTRYPLSPLEKSADAPRFHIVWLVAESLRADMLTPELMPETWAFSGRAARFTRHYSGGNGTRVGMFSMFYGLPGPYWNPFADEHRGPVLMDFLLREGYDVRIFTSAAFSYPEFDRTLWARVPADRMTEATVTPRWQRDQEIVGLLEKRFRSLEAGAPSFTFQFFESTHAPYTFPEDCAVHKPYLEDFNYFSADYRRSLPQIRNRYLNACRHLDVQLGRVFRSLEEAGLLPSTIVVLTGDHGEEFLEKSHWGHNSAFTEEQTRVPLVLWVPGRPPQSVDRFTSHLDLPATILSRLGVTTAPDRYSTGVDLFGPELRDHVIVSDWNDAAYVDADVKISLPMKHYDLLPKVTNREDAPILDAASLLEKRRGALLRLLRDLGRFRS